MATPKKAPAAKKAAPAKATAKPDTGAKPEAKKDAPAKATATATATKADGAAAPAIASSGPMLEHFNLKFLEAQHKLLLEEREQYTGSAEWLQAEARQLTEEYEPGDVQFDDESGEGDSIVVARERDLALSAQAMQIIAEIDAALERLATGTYGVSEVSGLPIPKARLEAIPWTSVRVEEKVGGIGQRR